MLITQLFLSLHSRPVADMKDLFRFENQREPPTLADRGLLRSGTKFDILKCLNAPTCHGPAAKQATVVVLDMAAVIRKQRHSASMCRFISYHILRNKYPS